MDVEFEIFSAPHCLFFHGTCPSARLWLALWKVDDPLWRHALYSGMHRQSGPSLLCAGQRSKMGLVVARLAEDGLCPRCKPEMQGGSRGPHAPLVDLPGERAVQVTVKLVVPLQLPVFRTHCPTHLRAQESFRQVGMCSPWKSSSVS